LITKAAKTMAIDVVKRVVTSKGKSMNFIALIIFLLEI
jgi:hypothetical protein